MSDILEPERIVLHGTARTRDDAIREVGALLVGSGAVTQAYADAMFDRENSVSTYMGNELAIPHGTNEAKDGILRSALSFVRYDEPIDWGGNPVTFAIGIAGQGDEHLEILSAVAIAFSDEEQLQRLRDAATPADVLAVLEV